jgi:putative transposase
MFIDEGKVRIFVLGVPHTSVLRVGFWSGSMPKELKRYYGQGHLHFLTFSCYRRLPFLRTARARDVFVAALAKIRERYHFLLVGYVVMPEHVHLLISEGPKCTPSLVLKVLKQRVSRDLRKQGRRAPAGQMGLPFKDGAATLPRFWQPRFYDFNVYSAKKIREKLEYMHANPVKRGLVGNPREWVWSSFNSYEKGEGGLAPIDFAG